MNWRTFCFLLLGVGLLACSDEQTDTGGAGTTTTVDRPEFRRTDNVARIVLRSEPKSLNPLLSTESMSRLVWEQIFQTLTEVHPQTLEQAPLLAAPPTIRNEAGGGVSYAYEINEAATWPNGLPVTADDVVFSLKIILNPLVNAGPYRSYYSMVTNVVTSPANERRFRVLTDKPYLLAEEALGSIPVYPEYAFDPEGLLRDVRLADLTDDATANRLAENNPNLKAFAEAFNKPETARDPERLVGSGPYRLVEWQDGQRVRLERRDNYWAAGADDGWLRADPEALVFEIITDNNTVGNALRDEAVDVVYALEVDQFQEFAQDDYLTARYAFEAVPSSKYYAILLNQDDPMMADVGVRRAFAHSVNVDAIIEQLFPGLAERVVGPVLPAKSYFNENLQSLDYDLDRARELLAEAGWADTNGDGTVDKEIDGQRRELSFDLLSFPSPLSEAVTLVAAEGARQAGMDVKVVKQEPRALYGELGKGNFVAAIYGQGSSTGPDDFTQGWASTSVPPQGTNRGNFRNEEADRLMRRIRTTTDAKVREPLYRRFQEIVYENQPMIFLFSPSERVVVSKRFDFVPTAVSPNVDYNALRQRDWNRPAEEPTR